MSVPILVQLSLFSETPALSDETEKQDTWLNLHDAWLHRDTLPRYVAQSPTVTRILDLIGPLDWSHLPERDLKPTLGHAKTCLLFCISDCKRNRYSRWNA